MNENKNSLWSYAEQINQYSGWNKDFVFGALLMNISRNLGKVVQVKNISTLRPRPNLYVMLVAPPFIEQKSTILDWEDKLSKEIQNIATEQLKDMQTQQGKPLGLEPSDHTTQLIGSDLAIEDALKQYKDVHFKHSEFGSILFTKRKAGRYDERNLSILNDGFYGIVNSHNFRNNSTKEVDDTYITAFVDAHRNEINSDVLTIGLIRRFIVIIKDFQTLVPEDKIKLYSLENETMLSQIEKDYEKRVAQGLCNLINAMPLVSTDIIVDKDGLRQHESTYIFDKVEIIIPQETLDEIIRNSLETYQRVKQEETLMYQHENDELVLRGALNLAIFDFIHGDLQELVVLPEHVQFMRNWLQSISQPLKEEIDKVQTYDFLDKLKRLQSAVNSYYSKHHEPISIGMLTNNIGWFKELDHRERGKLLNECVQRQMFMGFIFHSGKQRRLAQIFLPNQEYDDANKLLSQYNIITDDAVEYSSKYFS